VQFYLPTAQEVTKVPLNSAIIKYKLERRALKLNMNITLLNLLTNYISDPVFPKFRNSIYGNNLIWPLKATSKPKAFWAKCTLQFHPFKRNRKIYKYFQHLFSSALNLFILPVNQFISDKLFICRWHTQVWVWYPFLLWLLFTHFK